MKTTSHTPVTPSKVLLDRLSRIEGQIKGLRASLLTGKGDCAKDMLQVKATHAAIKAFARAYMSEYASHCAKEERLSPRSVRNLDTIISSAFIL
jgi:DNA-binding FrmR family transcriptional regulator